MYVHSRYSARHSLILLQHAHTINRLTSFRVDPGVGQVGWVGQKVSYK